ncbi:MAG: 3,4-dehydroadipyl-CoA semialdehyde dehydrogenase [Polyangiaceae bacterium]
MMNLKSYVAGDWFEGKSSKATLVNPATEEVVAETSTEGIDFGKCLAYARDVGGPLLRGMTFKERGEVLRAMSKSIHAKRDELFQLAIQNGGNTRSDAKFDIDGAWGTLAAYADLAAELGDRKVLSDGEAFQLGRSPRLYGAHVYTPRRGVAVHVNAFNFPAWGLAEKAATALLAGMPVISKPATSTALVAARIMEILVNDKVLPQGALSFVCGSAGNLLSLLGGQDVLAFTGGSSTGTTLRSGEGILKHGTHINVEADSLNAAVLGPDVEEGGDVWNLFLGDVVRDMTQKTGQKCTAIRRVYVPKERAEAVLAELRDRLSSVKVGNPALEEVNMGPVATATQLKDVRSGIERLAACGKVVLGGPKASDVKPLGQTGDKGYFVAPTLLFVENPKAGDAVHSHEVFGPVSSVMPYDGTAEGASKLVSAGEGGLVASVYSDDKAFIESAIVEMAPFHGRLTVGSSKIAAQALPPGTVMPQLLHGGPGRAGGGEELGGRRGLAFYMQRTALQGDRSLIEPVHAKL